MIEKIDTAPQPDVTDELPNALSKYRKRLELVMGSEEITQGLRTTSRVIETSVEVMRNHDIPFLWLPPIDATINEYTGNDYQVSCPLTGKKYSLIQSPQVLKEAAAIAFGSNYRITTCYRPEPGDATHAQMFQQLDVELRDGDGTTARALALEILQRTGEAIIGSAPSIIPELDYLLVKELYGEESPNLYDGLLLDYVDDGTPVLRGGSSVLPADLPIPNGCYLLHPQNPRRADFKLYKPEKDDDWLIFGDTNKLREIRSFLVRNGVRETPSPVSAYWLVNMPYATYNPDGSIKPLHHVMTLPHGATNHSKFTFFDYSDHELTTLPCDSYDLMVCTKEEVVEIAGGDQRIPTATLQEEAIRRMGFSTAKYAFLLTGLGVNENLQRPYSLAGFAFGLERLAMIYTGLHNIDQVQFSPANSQDGSLYHAI